MNFSRDYFSLIFFVYTQLHFLIQAVIFGCRLSDSQKMSFGLDIFTWPADALACQTKIPVFDIVAVLFMEILSAFSPL